MKKLFFALLFLCFLGAGILWWLMQAVPAPSPLGAKLESDVTVKEASDAHGEASKEDGDAEKTHEDHAEDADELGHAATSDEAHSDGGATGEHEKSNQEKGAQEPKHSAETSLSAAESPRLTIVSDPVGANVLVDGQVVGKTPYVLTLRKVSQLVTLRREGHEEFSRDAPPVTSVTGPEAWNVKLRPLERKAAAPKKDPESVAAAHEDPAPETERAPKPARSAPRAVQLDPRGYFYIGNPGPWFIQVKAVTDEEAGVETFLADVDQMRELFGSNLHACRVDLPGKGRWARTLLGPYPTKARASETLGLLKSRLPNGAFVTGSQSCLE